VAQRAPGGGAMKLKIEIDLDNDALVKDESYELKAVFEEIRKRRLQNMTTGRCRDSNGNTVGTWIVEQN
jgi:hypothetical protein